MSRVVPPKNRNGRPQSFERCSGVDNNQHLMRRSVMTRYWITFVNPKNDKATNWVGSGVGVTAPSLEAALKIIERQMFADEQMPKVLNCIEDVDVSTLDAHHVLPNMGLSVSHGIWFPQGFQHPPL